jgi:hypothetical protein
MQGFRRIGEEETERTSKERKTEEKGSLARGAASDLRGGGGDWVNCCRMLLAATEDLVLLVPLTKRALAPVVPTRTARAVFIDVCVCV